MIFAAYNIVIILYKTMNFLNTESNLQGLMTQIRKHWLQLVVNFESRFCRGKTTFTAIVIGVILQQHFHHKSLGIL